MKNLDVTKLTIESLHEGLVGKKFSAQEVTDAYFEKIRDTDHNIHAYLTLHEEEARSQAKTVDEKIARGDALGPLAGAPLAVKDVIVMKGSRTTAASKTLEHYVGSYDATAIRKLRAEGVVFLGKTNLDEFAMGSSTENSAFGPTKNPHDTARVPGGSSGGSAAAVAADMALASLGTDTGGSIRQPAALCGVVGLKTTYGAISRSGLIALASSLDQIGPFAKTVRDTAILFKAIAGSDAFDATSVLTEYGDDLVHPDFAAIKELTVGLPKEYFEKGLEPQVENAVQTVISTLRAAGIAFKEVSLPHTKYALSTYYIVLPAEASANLARFDGIRYERNEPASTLRDIYFKNRARFGVEVKRRIILGTFVLSSGYYDAYYEKAQRVRTLIARDFEYAFKEVDVLLAPTTPTPAFKVGEKAADPLSMYLSDIFTIPANLAGVPAVSIPVRGVSGLPVGFQLVGRHFREADILGLGQFYEKL